MTFQDHDIQVCSKETWLDSGQSADFAMSGYPIGYFEYGLLCFV